jgi:hypothetical protein
MELPCVIGYHVVGLELRDVVLAALADGQVTYAGVVELGVRQDLLGHLEGLHTRAPAVACSMSGRSVRWVRPEVFCTVRLAGWRPGGVWRDAIVARWE